jgi:acetyl/propionyl-CoA carboxylase alpha subunit
VSKIGVSIDGRTYTVDVKLDQRADSELTVVVNGETLRVTVPEFDRPPDKMEWIIVGGRPYEIVLDADLHWIKGFAGLHRVEARDLEAVVARPVSGDGRVKAPIPGLITRIFVEAEDHVELGQPLLVLEAMKMENEVRAPCTGKVGRVDVRPGQDVTLHQILAEIV